MTIKRIDYDFSICKVTDYSQVDLESEYCFIGKTEEEKSLVCITDQLPDNTDYILIKKENFDKATDVLSGAGYEVIG